MPLYVKIHRTDTGTSYFQPISEIHNAIQGEMDGAEAKDIIMLEVVEMSNDEYNKLPEFTGH